MKLLAKLYRKPTAHAPEVMAAELGDLSESWAKAAEHLRWKSISLREDAADLRAEANALDAEADAELLKANQIERFSAALANLAGTDLEVPPSFEEHY